MGEPGLWISERNYNKLTSVYDAAMAYRAAVVSKEALLVGASDYELSKAWERVDQTWDRLMEACRKAEEVERG